MKKNRMMRLGAILLVCVLMTTAVISGTFAKYVTDVPEASDTARVANWGVKGSITGAAFLTEYNLDTEVDGTFTLAVASSTTDKLVAPGTTGTFTGINLTGTPEVAVRITTEATLTLEGWEVDGDFYCPIVFTINEEDISGLDFTEASELIAAVKAAIEAANGDYEPKTNLSTVEGLNGNYTWAWAFDGDATKDTALGDAAADGNAATITLAVSTQVEQID